MATDPPPPRRRTHHRHATAQHRFNESESCLADREKNKTQLDFDDFWVLFFLLALFGVALVAVRIVVSDFGIMPERILSGIAGAVGGGCPGRGGDEAGEFADDDGYAANQYEMIRKVWRWCVAVVVGCWG